MGKSAAGGKGRPVYCFGYEAGCAEKISPRYYPGNKGKYRKGRKTGCNIHGGGNKPFGH